jgi:hypothetical protein
MPQIDLYKLLTIAPHSKMDTTLTENQIKHYRNTMPGFFSFLIRKTYTLSQCKKVIYNGANTSFYLVLNDMYNGTSQKYIEDLATEFSVVDYKNVSLAVSLSYVDNITEVLVDDLSNFFVSFINTPYLRKYLVVIFENSEIPKQVTIQYRGYATKEHESLLASNTFRSGNVIYGTIGGMTVIPDPAS